MDQDMTVDATPAPEAAPAEVQAPEPEVTQAPNEGVDTPDVALQTDTSNEVEDNDVDWDSLVPVPSAATQVTPNEDGFIDPVAYKESIKAELREEMKFNEQERKAWAKLEEQYPGLAKDKNARELILAKRLYDVQNGGNGSLSNAAKAVMGRETASRQAGKADAQVSITQQKAAGVAGSTAPRDTSRNDTMDRLRSGDSSVIQDVVKNMLDQGKI